MSANNFQAAMDFIWAPDRDGAKNDSAPGEQFATAYGVTQMTWDSAVADGIVSGALADATKDQCEAIYRVRYWNALHASSLQDGVDLMMFNSAVLAGAGHAAKLLQRIVGAEQDGAIGPDTLRHANSFGVKALIDAIADGDEAFFASLANAPLFLRGWTRREEAARQLAYKMARITSGVSA